MNLLKAERGLLQALSEVGGRGLREDAPQVGWDVFLRGKKIDTVFSIPSDTADEVKRSLIQHDGYDRAITVKPSPESSNGVDEAARRGKKPVGKIEDETPIMPIVIADSVIRELLAFGIELPNPDEYADELATRADTAYQHNDDFRKKIRSAGNAGRDWLYAFMRHWLSSLVQKKDRAAYAKISPEFRMGHEPQGVR